MCSHICNLWIRSRLLAEKCSYSNCGVVLAVHHVVQTVKVETHTLLRFFPIYLSAISRERYPGTPFSRAAHPNSQQCEQHWTSLRSVRHAPFRLYPCVKANTLQRRFLRPGNVITHLLTRARTVWRISRQRRWLCSPSTYI